MTDINTVQALEHVVSDLASVSEWLRKGGTEHAWLDRSIVAVSSIIEQIKTRKTPKRNCAASPVAPPAANKENGNGH